jgi:hypothetical protein
MSKNERLDLKEVIGMNPDCADMSVNVLCIEPEWTRAMGER